MDVIPPQIENPLEKSSGTIRKIFNTSSWLVLFAFLPITVLILLSQNAIPGDLFYPVKRSLENAVLAAASVNPSTRVAFRTDLTERRFDEAEKLLARADTAGLNGFIEEMQTTQQELSVLSNIDTKQELTEKLVKQIDEYQVKLDKAQAQNQSSLPAPSPIPTATPFAVKISSPTPMPTSFTEPTSAAPTQEPAPTQVTIAPTIIPSPSDTIDVAIDDAKEQLEEIKNKLLEEHGRKVKNEERKSDLKNFSDSENKDNGKKDKEKEDNRGKREKEEDRFGD